MSRRLFPITSSVYLVPWWIDSALKRHGMKTEDILYVDKVKSILSNDDLITIESMNRYSSLNDKESLSTFIFGRGDRPRDDVCGNNSIIYEWISRCNNEETKKFLTDIVDKLASSSFQRDTYMEKLFSAKLKAEGPFFRLVPVDGEVMIVVLEKSISQIGLDNYSDKERYELNRELLKHFYMYEQAGKVNDTPIFYWYLNALAH